MTLVVAERPARPYGAEVRGHLPDPVIVHRGSPDYPDLLEDVEPPRQLWCLGNSDLLMHRPMVAIVGTRNATAYGERIARELARAVAAAGGCIVSGMARGVDSAAHRGALDVGGQTIAVLGTGVDVVYPAGNRALHATIAAKGLVLSEMPPGQAAFKGCFPRRNRIIAALARVTVVVEAGVKSGALLTAEIARAIGREVAGVPGPIDSPQSTGINQLVRDGAQMLTCIEDVFSLAGLSAARRTAYEPGGPDERAVFAALAEGPLAADVIAARTGLPAARCFAAVTALELAGAIECSLGGTIRRR